MLDERVDLHRHDAPRAIAYRGSDVVPRAGAEHQHGARVAEKPVRQVVLIPLCGEIAEQFGMPAGELGRQIINLLVPTVVGAELVRDQFAIAEIKRTNGQPLIWRPIDAGRVRSERGESYAGSKHQ